MSGELGEAVGEDRRRRWVRAHRLALELRPTALDDLGLESVLLNYTEDWAERSGIEVDCQISEPGGRSASPATVETAIYRITQEALTNVLKHARAKHLSLILKRRDGQVVAIIEDDGCGFDVDTVLHSPGFGAGWGCWACEERVASLGGTLQIESSPGGGTTLFVAIPLSPGQETSPWLPTANPTKLRVYLADDHEVVRRGLRALVSTPNWTWRWLARLAMA